MATAINGVEPVYLNFSDLSASYFWVGSTLAFSYRIDTTCLQHALQRLQCCRPALAGRFLQTPEGRYCIGYSGEDREIPFTVKDNLQVQLSELPNMYAERRISDASPSNSLLPDFIPQLHPHLLLSGKEAFFQVQLTQVQDGSVLGFSFSHGLTDYEGIGYALAELACLYRGDNVAAKQNNRMWLALQALRGTNSVTSVSLSDEEVIQRLPCFPAPPRTFVECVASGKFDLLSCSAEERAAGQYHDACVLHLPSASIDRLRSQIMAERAGQDGEDRISANDIMCATLWLMREIANGNDLQLGLQKCFIISTDLRKNGAAASIVPEKYFGNAVGGSFCMPPDACTSSQDPAATAETSSHVQETAVKSTKASGAHYLSILTAAAGAVRGALQAFRADPSCLETQAASATQYLQHQQVHDLLASADFVPVRDAALWVSSWRHMATDNVDFGGGKAKYVIGSLMPAQTRAVNVTAGPDGDGLMCIIRLPKDGLTRVTQSQLLDLVAPEAQLII